MKRLEARVSKCLASGDTDMKSTNLLGAQVGRALNSGSDAPKLWAELDYQRFTTRIQPS